jgi:flavin reductase (DIM6/NTAB) family NADH-FMN oxidoreductase RutF
MAEALTATLAARSLKEQIEIGLRRLGKPVAVITCWDGERRWAKTATAVSELSMDPPSLLICIDRQAGVYAPITAGANFCVNILHADQLAISERCGGQERGEGRFREGRWDSAACGTPYLRGCEASLVCEYQTHMDHGTSAIVIGAVTEVQIGAGEVDPLIYVDGHYAHPATDL